MTDLRPLKLFSTSPGGFSLILGDHKPAEVADLFEAEAVDEGDWD